MKKLKEKKTGLVVGFDGNLVGMVSASDNSYFLNYGGSFYTCFHNRRDIVLSTLSTE